MTSSHTWVLATVLAIPLSVLLLIAVVPRRQDTMEWRAAELARRLLLRPRAGIAEPLDTRRRWAGIGQVAGSAAGGLVVLLTTASRSATSEAGWIFAVLAAGTAGSVLGALVPRRREQPTGSALVGRDAGAADLLPALERRALLLSAPVAVVALVAVALGRGPSPTIVLLMIVVVIAGVVARAGISSVTMSARVASTPEELVWIDALRAADVRALAEAAWGTAALALVAAAFAVFQSGLAVMLSLAPVAFVTVLELRSSRAAGRRFETTLWPAGVPGGVEAAAE